VGQNQVLASVFLPLEGTDGIDGTEVGRAHTVFGWE